MTLPIGGFNNISIHAPSRERPSTDLIVLTAGNISIHAPSRERLAAYAKNWSMLEFQSTLPRGSDLMYLGEFNDKTCISIHAPSRERPCRAFAVIGAMTFQSTLPRGSDVQ